MVGEVDGPFAVALRGNLQLPGLWVPPRLNIRASEEIPWFEQRANIVDQLVRGISASRRGQLGDGKMRGGNSALQTFKSTLSAHAGHAPDGAPTLIADFLIQAMCPAMIRIGEAVGVVWTHCPYTGESGPTGYVRVMEGPDIPKYVPYGIWAERETANANDIITWLETASSITGDSIQFSFGVAGHTVHLLGVHNAILSEKARSRIISEHFECGRLSSEEKLMFARPEDLPGRRSLHDGERNRLTPLASTAVMGSAFASGRVALSDSQLDRFLSLGDPIVRVMESLVSTDVPILEKIVGVVTRTGGGASHLIVAARGRGLAVLPGLDEMILDNASGTMRIGSNTVRNGDWITIDESSGTLYLGKAESHLQPPSWISTLRQLTSTASGVPQVLVNADTPTDANRGVESSAGGVGLCRSEVHLLDHDAIKAFRLWLMESSDPFQLAVPEAVLNVLRRRLMEMLVAVEGRIIHYRLLDPHFEDILPRPGTREAIELGVILGMNADLVDTKLGELREAGRSQGLRGCRWGIHSGFYRHQLQLLVDAAKEISQDGRPVRLAVIVPMVSTVEELRVVRRMLSEIAGDSWPRSMAVHLGCMIETPRACVIIGELARESDVLCFGTNDLTESIWALSRDSGKGVLSHWLAEGTVQSNPFVILDRLGVGSVIENAVEVARKVKPSVSIGACGEQAADPRSAAWFIHLGVDWVSCRADAVLPAALAIMQFEVTHRATPSAPSWPIWRSSAAEASERVYERIRHARAARSNDLAHRLSFEWGEMVGVRLSLPEVWNWKFFKRDIVQLWFGPREHRRFQAGWNSEDVLSYAIKHRVSGRLLRYSLFPSRIACHAISRVLDDREPAGSWLSELDSLDHTVPLEVFPQQPLSNICFRAIFWGERIDVEAGIGQAMYVFEEQRGRHPVRKAVVNCQGTWQIVGLGGEPGDEQLTLGLQKLLERYGLWLYLRLWDMSTVLGTQWSGIEGYYDPEDDKDPFICDMDLPQDLAFLG